MYALCVPKQNYQKRMKLIKESNMFTVGMIVIPAAVECVREYKRVVVFCENAFDIQNIIFNNISMREDFRSNAKS